MSEVKMSDVADKLMHIREEIAEINKQLEMLNDLKKQSEEHLMELMSNEGISSFRVGDYNIRMTKSEVPSVVDWDAYYEYIKANDAFYLLERRPATKAWRETREFLDGEVPGTEAFTKVNISMTKVG